MSSSSSSEFEHSDDDLHDIIKDLVVASPPNELREIDDCLTQIGVSVEPTVFNFERAEQYGHIVESDDVSCILSASTKMSPKQYIDTTGTKVVTLSEELTISEVEELDPELVNNSNASLVGDLTTTLNQYVEEYYKKGVYTIVNLNDRPFEILFACSNVNKASSYAGHWFSRFLFSSDLATVSPNVMPYVHMFESGNVHLRGKNPKSETKVTLSEVSAESIAKHIRKFEVDYLVNVGNLWETVNDRVMKSFRRKLPVFRKKIDWTTISALRMKIPNK
ncbi:hypothetical protein P9112_011051 [Eukaryota sp. TZLM1-RC]